MRCTCGNEFWTRSTQGELHVEICSNCHPFYTGKQKLVDTGGRVERFRRRAAAPLSAARPAQLAPSPSCSHGACARRVLITAALALLVAAASLPAAASAGPR